MPEVIRDCITNMFCITDHFADPREPPNKKRLSCTWVKSTMFDKKVSRKMLQKDDTRPFDSEICYGAGKKIRL